MRFKTTQYDKLVEKGCLCGTEQVAKCPVHPEPTDNRGLRAFYQAGMPKGFPSAATCTICGSDGLMYPDIELDDPKRGDDGPPKHRPTLVCPQCSGPGGERRLRSEAEDFGYVLNERAVFATTT